MAKKMKQKSKAKAFWAKVLRVAICIAIPVAVGGISALITGNSMSKFGQFNQPPLSPPGWLFPVAWTILYVLMGIASYLVFIYKPKNREGINNRKIALVFYCIQLFFNFVWSPIFFLFGQYWFALAWLIVMWIMILMTTIYFAKCSKFTLICLLPYILWCSFATYLNFGVALLN